MLFNNTLLASVSIEEIRQVTFHISNLKNLILMAFLVSFIIVISLLWVNSYMMLLVIFMNQIFYQKSLIELIFLFFGIVILLVLFSLFD